VPEPSEFEPELLLKGKVHQVFSGPGSGKSWLALWLVMQAIERGETVLYLDMENGKRIISERLQDLGVSGEGIDEHLHYFDFPALDMGSEAKREYVSLLDKIKPHLIVFDSWVNFLAASGLEENSNTDVEQWSNAYVHQARIRDCTVVLLDHIPHEGNHSRGATRKKDMVDVQWRLKKVQDFDRGNVGYIQLMREKDREGWLPENVGFSVGGTDTGFIMKRSEGTVEKTGDGLPESARKALAALVSFGEAGATYTEWRKAT
jgi:predicted ATP-dependent serine protease